MCEIQEKTIRTRTSKLFLYLWEGIEQALKCNECKRNADTWNASCAVLLLKNIICVCSVYTLLINSMVFFFKCVQVYTLIEDPLHSDGCHFFLSHSVFKLHVSIPHLSTDSDRHFSSDSSFYFLRNATVIIDRSYNEHFNRLKTLQMIQCCYD